MSRDSGLSDPFKSDRHGGNPQMTVNGLSVILNLPKALTRSTDRSGKEEAQSLPPHNERPAFLVDHYPACPQSWPRSSGIEASYMVPIMSEHGLWLDFNGNNNHTHHVAALVSIQGVNALTGLPAKGSGLEQYKINCPKHNKPFDADRHCAACGFKWPAQNYLATIGTPRGMFWIDGFRASDGVVRQYVFTEQTIRGVAAQLIGEDRGFAIGIVFYLSKEPKPAPPRYRHQDYAPLHSLGQPILFGSSGADFSDGSKGPRMMSRSLSASRGLAHEEVQVGNIEIAAGARIEQNIYADSSGIDFWQSDPAGIVHINYASVEDCLKIIESGPVKSKASAEGFLDGLRLNT